MMKFTWLVVTVVGVAFAENIKSLQWKLIVGGSEPMQKIDCSADLDQQLDDQRLLKSAEQNRSRNMDIDPIFLGQKLDDITSILVDHAITVATKMDRLIDSPGAESRCPENAADGVYVLKPNMTSISSFPVYCENGWIVIHRRFNGSLDFNRPWVPYRDGFGDLQGEHWLGLEKMHQFTRVGSHELKVVLEGFGGEVKSAKFEEFKIGSEFEQYQLSLGKFVEGNAGDSLSYHNMMKFATSDRDNYQNNRTNVSCALAKKSGWWFKACYESNLNGAYENGTRRGMSWYSYNNDHQGLKEARMMIRDMKSTV